MSAETGPLPPPTSAGSSGADGAPPGRIIRSRPGGALLDAPFRLGDVPALTEALVRASEGRLERLRDAANEVETRLRRQIEDNRGRIARATEEAERRIEERAQETALRAAETIETARREGREQGVREGAAAGRAEGFEQGLREGREHALEEARERMRTLAPALEELVAGLARERRELREGAHRDLLDLALEIARRIVRREVESLPPVVIGTIRSAIERIDAKRGIVVEVHPADRAAAEECLTGLLGGLASEGSFAIIERPELTRGGCLVRTEHGMVDDTIETRFELIGERLLGREEVLG